MCEAVECLVVVAMRNGDVCGSLKSYKSTEFGPAQLMRYVVGQNEYPVAVAVAQRDGQILI